MTDMYDKPKLHDGRLKPYPHAERNMAGGAPKDPVGCVLDIEQRARERQVAYETVRLLRQKMIHCYRTEGINHYENCRDVAQDYYDVVTKKDMGQLQPNWSDPKMGDGW